MKPIMYTPEHRFVEVVKYKRTIPSLSKTQVIDESNFNDFRCDTEYNDSDRTIYDTMNMGYLVKDGRLYLPRNLDTTETMSINVFICLGTIVEEFDEIS